MVALTLDQCLRMGLPSLFELAGERLVLLQQLGVDCLQIGQHLFASAEEARVGVSFTPDERLLSSEQAGSQLFCLSLLTFQRRLAGLQVTSCPSDFCSLGGQRLSGVVEPI